MNKTISVSILAVVILAFVHLAEAQQTKKVPRIGYLGTGSPSSTKEVVEAFQQGLRDLGYIEGQNITIEYRSTEGMAERLPNLAAELVQLKVDIIVVGGSPSTQAAKNATKTIPIVMTNVTDPVGIGLITSKNSFIRTLLPVNNQYFLGCVPHIGGRSTRDTSQLKSRRLGIFMPEMIFPKIVRGVVVAAQYGEARFWAIPPLRLRS